MTQILIQIVLILSVLVLGIGIGAWLRTPSRSRTIR
jgi:hypothetical protein